MTTPSANDKPEPAGGHDEPSTPGSGHGAQSALNALIKRRVPSPEPPPMALPDEPQ